MRDRLPSLVVFLALATPFSASGDPPPPTAPDAEALIREGLDLRRQGQERAALPYFQRAYDLSHTPRSAAQLGFAEQALGMWVEAERHLTEARAADKDPWIREHRNLLDESAGFVRAHLGLIEVETNVAQAEVLVDGRSAGRTPLEAPLRVAIGQRRIELRAASYRPAGRAVEVTTGQTLRVTLPLIRLAGAVEPAPPPADLRIVTPEPIPVSRPLHRRWELWAGIGAAVVAAVVIVAATSGGPGPYPCGGGDRVCAR